ncbi:MAG TPA: RsbRD N-terminal domain-containing protein, partial [Gemmatimonadaceae bacterium]|nr:RsbRD N-terminal domain-containing protein [Gemmatimonadaceae bacterium]
AERIRESHAVIASQWLDRLRELLPVGSNEIFPTNELLDHIPALIRDVSEYVRAPEAESVAANTAVLAKAQELGRLRYAQKASVHQLLQEYRILGAILAQFVKEQVVLLRVPPAAPDTLDVLARLQESVGVLLQTTVDTFVAAYADTIARQRRASKASAAWSVMNCGSRSGRSSTRRNCWKPRSTTCSENAAWG